MNETQAKEMGEFFRATGKFSRVDVRQRGGEFAVPGSPWEVELWSVNSASGNRNLTVLRDFTAKASERKMLTRKAMGKATKRDNAAFARIAAEREMDRE